jgi:hypothetical protein
LISAFLGTDVGTVVQFLLALSVVSFTIAPGTRPEEWRR